MFDSAVSSVLRLFEIDYEDSLPSEWSDPFSFTTGGGDAGVLKVSKNSSLIADEFRIYFGQKDLQEYSEFIRALLRG